MSAYYHTKYGYGKKRKRKSPLTRFLIILLILIILIAGTVILFTYINLYKPNVWVKEGKSMSLTIPTGADFEQAKAILYGKGLIINRKTFERVARKKKYTRYVKPGRYIVYAGMGNNELINLLISGSQTPVKVIFNNIRDKEQLAKKISDQIEADSSAIMELVNDPAFLAQYGLTTENVSMIFIPNTYEFYWNTDAQHFFERMYNEYLKFWNEERQNKLRETGLTREEAMILASIIEKETNKDEEKPIIAGVYINRLRRNWFLQADPTVVYATGNFAITRVLNEHKAIDSPYNTYLYPGLPPGPICIPSIASIDAVLNYDSNDYLFFCARDDLSGYHAFTASYTQHLINARKYQKALDNMRIRK